MARALAHEPKVLLLDELFGALEPKIRLDLRHALRTIQRSLSLTTVYVTHDQEEAFERADRLAVLRQGRLLEVGSPQELHQRPRSPLVDTFLGAANLLVGESDNRTVRVGPVELPLGIDLLSDGASKRTQVLFRPEDVEISSEAQGRYPRLGRGRVEEHAVLGGFERLRLRLPLLGNGRSVAPPAPFGAEYLLVDTMRPQHEATRLPLGCGDSAWVAIHRFHVLTSARLRLLIDPGKSDHEQIAAKLGTDIAARIHAHVTLASNDIAEGSNWSAAQVPEGKTEDLGEGFDIAVLGHVAEGRRGRLANVRHHVLLVNRLARLPTKFLVCVGLGEQDKAEIRLSERLAWQLGAAATVLTVLPQDVDVENPPTYVSRLMTACVAAPSARGVIATARLRRGASFMLRLCARARNSEFTVVLFSFRTR